LAPDLLGKGGKREQLGAGGIQVFGHLGQFVAQGVKNPIILSHNRFSIWLVEDGMQQRAHPGPGFRGDRHQVGRVVGSAALPGRPGQGGADRGDQPWMGIAGDQCDAGETAGEQVAEECQPASTVFGRRSRLCPGFPDCPPR
jgi:hypothetical protein